MDAGVVPFCAVDADDRVGRHRCAGWHGVLPHGQSESLLQTQGDAQHTGDSSSESLQAAVLRAAVERCSVANDGGESDDADGRADRAICSDRRDGE